AENDKITLMMSIGLTDHIWSLKELLTCLSQKYQYIKGSSSKTIKITKTNKTSSVKIWTMSYDCSNFS
ncbi:MAG: hypothetical protein LBR15_10855, partial [Methanobrevibacter sp.]|nr:hypothetical protein [Candidatus Methanovirga australis]